MPATLSRVAGVAFADTRALRARFDLPADLLTADRANAKLAKGAALGRAVILHHLPARALAQAITPAELTGAACRGHLPAVLELAERTGSSAAALAHNGCPWATAGCAEACLAWAGRAGTGATTIPAARARRTLAMVADPEAYGRAVLLDSLRHWRRAQAEGLPLAVRLRGTDEGPAVGWHRLPCPITRAEAEAVADAYGAELTPGALPLPQRLAALPGCRPYDYSAAHVGGPLGLDAQRAAGVDITSSFKADRATAVRDALAALGAGFRLAVPVDLPRGAAIPSALILRAQGERSSVRVATVDGDAHDHRWADPQGVAVILRTKRSAGARAEVADPFSLAPHDRPQPLADGSARLIW
jgi:hypothetical protein